MSSKKVNLKPIALITGSTKGIGKSIAKTLENQNYTVIRNGRRKLNNRNYVQADLSNLKGINKIINYVNKKFGYINVLVNNAAYTEYIKFSNYKKLTDKIYNKIFFVNFTAPYKLCTGLEKALLKSKKKNDIKPHIINIASIAGITGEGSNIAYCASKGAVITLTKSLSKCMKPIRVNSISPGLIKTGFVKFPKKHYREYAKRTLVNKIGLPEDVAHLVNLLLKNKYISGQNIVIDGGGGGVN